MTPLEIGLSSMRFIDPSLETNSTEPDLVIELIERARSELRQSLPKEPKKRSWRRNQPIEGASTCESIFYACRMLGIAVVPVTIVRVAHREIRGGGEVQKLRLESRMAAVMGKHGLTYDINTTMDRLRQEGDATTRFFNSFSAEPGEEIEAFYEELDLQEDVTDSDRRRVSAIMIGAACRKSARAQFEAMPVLGRAH